MAIFHVDLGKPDKNVFILDFIGAKSNGDGGNNWSYKTCIATVVTTNKPTSSFFTGRMPFLSPNQQCQSTEGKNLIVPSIIIITK